MKEIEEKSTLIKIEEMNLILGYKINTDQGSEIDNYIFDRFMKVKARILIRNYFL